MAGILADPGPRRRYPDEDETPPTVEDFDSSPPPEDNPPPVIFGYPGRWQAKMNQLRSAAPTPPAAPAPGQTRSGLDLGRLPQIASLGILPGIPQSTEEIPEEPTYDPEAGSERVRGALPGEQIASFFRAGFGTGPVPSVAPADEAITHRGAPTGTAAEPGTPREGGASAAAVPTSRGPFGVPLYARSDTHPIGAGVDPPPTPVDESLLPDEARARALQAGHESAPVRAIRLPNGHMLFTNTGVNPSSGGEEMTAGQGADVVRAQTLHKFGPEGPSRVPGIDQTSETMRALVRASARAAAVREGTADAPGPGAEPLAAGKTIVPGPGLDPTNPDRQDTGIRPGVSMIEGTPQQQVALRIEDALQAAALGKAETQAKISRMSPEAQAQLADKNIPAMAWIRGQYLPRIDAIHTKAAADKIALSRPGSSTYVADTKERAKAEGKIDDQARLDVAPLLEVMTTSLKQRLPIGMGG